MARTKINAPIELSSEFAEFMGSAKATRGDVTKAVWAHIRENNLKDDSGVVRFDETLQDLLQSSQMRKASDLFKLLKKVGAFTA